MKKFEIFLRSGNPIQTDFILVSSLENAGRGFVKNDVLFYCLIEEDFIFDKFREIDICKMYFFVLVIAFERAVSRKDNF